jgi:acyl-CoA reductase-like NAD-dependent aldehyde dehydrogenase
VIELETRLLIDGRFVAAAAGNAFTVISPITGRPYAEVASAGAEDLDRAAAAARRAFDEGPWPRLAPFERGRTLRAIADRIRGEVDVIAEVETRSGGKTIADSRNEVEAAARVFDYYAGAMDKYFGETIPMGRGVLDFTLREPIGVCGLIVPWNFPINMASWKLGPALAAGNTAILKPASYTPLTAIRLGELALEAGIPPGVVNVVTGPGGAAGAALAAHPGVGKVAFTGETTTGQEIMRLAANNVKKVSLELGGKSPNIVFADADLERWAAEAPYAVFDNAGQDCCARSRIFVEASIHDRAVELLQAATAKVKLGAPSEDETEVGSLVSFKQRERVLDYVASGRDEGAELVTGGVAPTGDPFDIGAYLQPTIFDGCRTDMRIVREEIFGPVVTVIPFSDEAEAVRLANDTPYGLSGSIWSSNLGRALRVAKGIKAGVLSVNSNASVHTEAPFGGYKMSGVGRELGMHALELYTELKNVFVDLR